MGNSMPLGMDNPDAPSVAARPCRQDFPGCTGACVSWRLKANLFPKVALPLRAPVFSGGMWSHTCMPLAIPEQHRERTNHGSNL